MGTKDEVEIRCPLRGCDFHITTKVKWVSEQDWKKIRRAFIQHLVEQHSAYALAELVYDRAYARSLDSFQL